ncbi:MAG: class I SAM-dependent methyltransferase [Rhodoblastus sp.]|nr:class I SAM-dependent methyltransferase [Rhodoblastus sp.]
MREWLELPSPLWGGAGGGGRAILRQDPEAPISHDCATPHPNPPPQGGRESYSAPLAKLRALDVGCGLGDNAEALAAAGAEVTAFDLSENAIHWAKRRFPHTRVAYRSADLFHPPAEWLGAFDLVNECYTLQALPNRLLPEAGAALASFLKPGGQILVIARSRPNPAAPDGPPWPLARGDVEGLTAQGLTLDSLEELTQPGEPAHWRALFGRAA